MDSNKIVKINAKERITDKAQKEGWEEDTDVLVMDMSDASNIADGFNLVKEGLKKISDATGIDLDSV